MDRRKDDEITEFVRARYSKLVKVAYLLCGDTGRAEDLVQTALAKVASAWNRLDRAEGVDHYVQRTLLNTYISAQRRRSWWERPFSRLAEQPMSDPYDVVDLRDVLRRALLALPPRQRAAIVLRHYQDLSEQQVAVVMGCSVGTVKSLTSRGLLSLRTRLGAANGTQSVEDKQGAARAY